MTSDTRPLRADAERNRARIVVAARAVFAEHGLGVTLDEVARHAGVGVGTVYRRFPGKDALISAVFDHVIDEIAALVDSAAADPDPWAGFTGMVMAMAERQAADRGLFELCTRADFGQVERIARIFVPATDILVARAKERGALRADFEAGDIGPLMVMIAASAELTRSIDPGLWRRYARLLLDGLRPGSAAPLPLRAPTHEEMNAACARART